MFTLENQFIRAAFDEKACLIHLENKASGRNVIARPERDSFRIVAKIDDNWEHVAFGREQVFEIEAKEDRLTARVQELVSRYQTMPVEIILSIRLDTHDIIYESTIKNSSQKILITDWTYPCVGGIHTLAGKDPDLLWPNHMGERHTCVTARESDLHLTYPGGHGRGASMQWMALVESDQTLSLSGRDTAIYSSELSVRINKEGESDQEDTVSLEMTKLPFARPGEEWICPPYHLSLYTGSWHQSADTYRTWSETWRRRPTPPKWVQNLTGYFLVINKQQYGEEFWPYDTLPELYTYAQENGCDTVGLFGWYNGGHDNTYPELVTSPTMGGDDGLRRGIKAVQEKGGHVTLYCQGHLLDLNTEFYQKIGHRIESKSRWMTPYFESYNKSHNSRFLALYTQKFFSNACPSCPEWQDRMAEQAKQLSTFAPNGFLYDQIGGMYPYPCFDDRHPHKENRPSLSFVPGRVRVLDRIQKTTKEINPDLAFFTEHITDIYSGYADMLHGMYTAPDPEGSRHPDECEKDRLHHRSRQLNYPELFRYTFPDTIVTIRNGRPYINRRFLNYAFIFGLRLEMELRYLDDQKAIRSDRYPKQREQASLLTAFRKRYWDILGTGCFLDEQQLICDNPAITAKVFMKDKSTLAVALWNDTADEQTVKVDISGYKWVKTDRPGSGTSEKNSLPNRVSLAAQEIALMLFKT